MNSAPVLQRIKPIWSRFFNGRQYQLLTTPSGRRTKTWRDMSNETRLAVLTDTRDYIVDVQLNTRAAYDQQLWTMRRQVRDKGRHIEPRHVRRVRGSVLLDLHASEFLRRFHEGAGFGVAPATRLDNALHGVKQTIEDYPLVNLGREIERVSAIIDDIAETPAVLRIGMSYD